MTQPRRDRTAKSKVRPITEPDELLDAGYPTFEKPDLMSCRPIFERQLHTPTLR
jgi:hypothetical protein